VTKSKSKEGENLGLVVEGSRAGEMREREVIAYHYCSDLCCFSIETWI